MIQWFSKKLKNRKGFTLIELIVVIAILGILALIAIPRLTGIQQTARLRADIASARTLAGAVAVAMAESTTTLTGTITEDTEINGNDFVPHYINSWPEVQAQAEGDFAVTIDPDNQIVVTANNVQVYPDAAGIYAPAED